jgi:hypothetical protein
VDISDKKYADPFSHYLLLMNMALLNSGLDKIHSANFPFPGSEIRDPGR